MMNRCMSKTRAYINIFSLDEENVIKRNPAVSYAAEQGHGGSNEDMQQKVMVIKDDFLERCCFFDD